MAAILIAGQHEADGENQVEERGLKSFLEV